MAKIKFDHTAMDTPAFVARMQEVITAMTGNPVFAALTAKVTALTTAVNNLDAKNTDFNATVQLCDQRETERDDLRDVAEASVHSLASASEGETTGEADLLSGGWHLVGAPTPPAPMPAPLNLSATGGDMEGEVDLQWEPVSGRDAYIAESATNPVGAWTQFHVGNNSSCTASGLNPGQMYYFRVKAVGPLGPGPWSDIAQKRAS